MSTWDDIGDFSLDGSDAYSEPSESAEPTHRSTTEAPTTPKSIPSEPAKDLAPGSTKSSPPAETDSTRDQTDTVHEDGGHSCRKRDLEDTGNARADVPIAVVTGSESRILTSRVPGRPAVQASGNITPATPTKGKVERTQAVASEETNDTTKETNARRGANVASVPPIKEALMPPAGGRNTQSASAKSTSGLELSEEATPDRSPASTSSTPSSTASASNIELYARIEKLHSTNKRLRAKLKEFSQLLDTKIDKAQLMRSKNHPTKTETTLEDAQVLRQELTNAEKQLTIYKRTNTRLQRMLDESDNIDRINELTDRIADLTHQNKELKSQVSALSTINRRTEKSHTQLEHEHRAYPKQIRTLQSEVRTLREKAREAQNSQRKLEQASLKDRTKIASLQQKCRTLEQEQQTRANRLKGSSTEISRVEELERELSEARKQLEAQTAKAFEQRAQFRRQLRKREKKIDDLERRIEDLDEQQTKMQRAKAVGDPRPNKRRHKKSPAGRNTNVSTEVAHVQQRLNELSSAIVPRDRAKDTKTTPGARAQTKKQSATSSTKHGPSKSTSNENVRANKDSSPQQGPLSSPSPSPEKHLNLRVKTSPANDNCSVMSGALADDSDDERYSSDGHSDEFEYSMMK